MSESRVVVLDREHGAERATATRVAGLDRWCVGACCAALREAWVTWYGKAW